MKNKNGKFGVGLLVGIVIGALIIAGIVVGVIFGLGMSAEGLMSIAP